MKTKWNYVKNDNPPLISIKSKHSEIVATANKMPLPLPIAPSKSDKTYIKPKTTAPIKNRKKIETKMSIKRKCNNLKAQKK